MAQPDDAMIAMIATEFLRPKKQYILAPKDDITCSFVSSFDMVMRHWFKCMVEDAIFNDKPPQRTLYFATKLKAHAGAPEPTFIELDDLLFNNDDWKQLLIEGLELEFDEDIHILCEISLETGMLEEISTAKIIERLRA